MTSLHIKKANLEEFQQVVDWAANEGWNPGLADLEAFYKTDPDGFLIGLLDSKVITAISVVKYNHAFGFLGFYITHPDYRGQGFGLKIWNEGIQYLSGTTIGLDGVLQQQDNYIASGFKFSGRNIRYMGIPELSKTYGTAYATKPPRDIDQPWIKELDRRCFGCARESFLHNWIGSQDQTRQTLVIFKQSKPCGFGTIRQCKSGYKIGPLFSTDPNAASPLFQALCELIPSGSEITLDIPQCNSKAMELTKDFGLEPTFETARMYRGTPPLIDWQNVYGITSFELG